MSNVSTPAASVARVILGSEGYTTARQILPAFLDGRTDAEAVRLWAMDGRVSPTDVPEWTALAQMLPVGHQAEVIGAWMEKQAKTADKRAALRISFSEKGRAVVNGLKLNQSEDGRGGIPLSLSAAQLSTLVDALPMLLGAVVDGADAQHDPKATKKAYNPAYDAGKKAGKTDDQLRAAGVAKLVDKPHDRAGQSVIDWRGCDKPATLAKFRAALESLRGAKS